MKNSQRLNSDREEIDEESIYAAWDKDINFALRLYNVYRRGLIGRSDKIRTWENHKRIKTLRWKYKY